MSSFDVVAAFAKALKREAWVLRHDRALQYKREGRAAAIAKVPEWEDLRERAGALKRALREDWDGALARFRRNAEAAGAEVHEAADAAEANAIVEAVLARHGARRVVKSKSMTTEECGLNEYLEQRGVTVVDTDLGEYIVQLLGQRPSHIVTPAVHLSRQEVGELFARHGLSEPGETDPTRLTLAARKALREVFLAAEAGITGANFLVADEGAAVVVENEGNSLLGTSLPPVHIVVAGIDKLVAGRDDLAVLLKLLARSATGQRITGYTTSYVGPQARGPAERGRPARELHVVLLDNGRRRLVGTPGEEALSCIRCGHCLTACPVFRRVGGHAYDATIPGPIGEVLGPGMQGRFDLPKASSLCGLCSTICPVKIDLAGAIHDWRAVARDQRTGKTGLPPGLGFALGRPRLFWWGTRLLRRTGRLSGPLLRGAPGLRRFAAGGERRLPEVPARSFRDWFAGHAREAGGTLAEAPKAPVTMTPADLRAPSEGPLPAAAPAAPADPTALEREFAAALAEAGGELRHVADLPQAVGATYAARALLARHGLERTQAPHRPEDLDGLAALCGLARWRVARTGSLWLDFADWEARVQALLPEELWLLVPRAELVWDLDGHYARLGGLPACGTLVTGPSKTADIELAVVKGAHGPRRLHVVVLP